MIRYGFVAEAHHQSTLVASHRIAAQMEKWLMDVETGQFVISGVKTDYYEDMTCLHSATPHIEFHFDHVETPGLGPIPQRPCWKAFSGHVVIGETKARDREPRTGKKILHCGGDLG